jgi:hypothetical protein
MANALAVTNLGPLERLGVRGELGALCLNDLFFVAAGSLSSPLCATVTSFAGKLSLIFEHVEPLVTAEQAGRVFAHAQAALDAYLAQPAEPVAASASAPS